MYSNINSSKQSQEYEVFNKFALAIGLLPNGFIQNREPTEPDILYTSNTGEKLAFELVEILDKDYSASNSQLFETKQICNMYLNQPTFNEAEKFKEAFIDADIYIDFCQKVSKNKKTSLMNAVFNILLSLPLNFIGDVDIKDNTLSKYVKTITVERGVVGPLFSCSSYNRIGEPTVDVIKSKLEKKYEPQGILMLLAYIRSNPMYPDEIWINKLENLLLSLNKPCQFMKIYVFDLNRSIVKFNWTN